MNPNKNDKVEFGDFQTPDELAQDIASLVNRKGVKPKTIIEPTCGKGSILMSAVENIDGWRKVIGLDINKAHIEESKGKISLCRAGIAKGIEIIQADFFTYDWAKLMEDASQPILVIGNLPWVTNSGIGMINGSNLPVKTNFLKRRGFDAISGKSNFDISEWMLIHLVDSLKEKDASIAMLCKTVVARKLIEYIWKNKLQINESAIYRIDAKRHFGANVDACLFFCAFGKREVNNDCEIYPDIASTIPENVIGFHDEMLINDVHAYSRLKHLQGEVDCAWRTGIKHDCSKVMEFVKEGAFYVNGFGEECHLENDYLYPFLKSSDVANGKIKDITKYVLITQKFVGQETDSIKLKAPKTWEYLQRYSETLGKRKSSIYEGKPQFSIFAIGDYAFLGWKVVISALYKRIDFKLVGRYKNKPVMVDDTCNYLAFSNEKEAILVYEMLSSERAKAFLNSIIFWDAKRPITINLLKKLSIKALLKENERLTEYTIAGHSHLRRHLPSKRPELVEDNTQLKISFH